MAISFVSGNYRAAASDLTIAISPLGLVELSDEEFEVHGPRLNRYSNLWAWYLGHHWIYKRQVGEPQATFNWCKTFADFHTNFALTNGVSFTSPAATQAIVPQLLRTVWEEHQPLGKDATLWELMQQGGVSGDCFIKVAVDQEFTDPSGYTHPSRIRVLPLNAAFCFPEYHPHDMSRMIRFKLKYRFWATAMEGTRQVYTYTELWTEDAFQSFINDELLQSQDNPLGRVPVIHISNTKVPSSPWGLADIQDILELNRIYNEVATEITDIVNYYASPMTVVIGAKQNDLIRGPNKVWSVTNDKARIEHLELGTQLDGPLAFLEMIKEKMHEIVGIPVNALGQEQAISNTSGVALSLQFLTLMQKWRQKVTQYRSGLARVNELIIRIAALYFPEMLEIDPERDPPLEEGQLSALDPNDPLTYRNSVVFASPLPIDKLIALNEIQMKMALGLESKIGALETLGEPYPREKLQELFNELYEDALEQGALDHLKAELSAFTMATTGVGPDGAVEGDEGAPGQPPGPPSPGGVPSAGGPGVNSASDVQPGQPAFLDDPDMAQIFNQLSTWSQGTKIPQLRNPSKPPSD